MIILTNSQARDLRYLVALHRLSVGITTKRPALGDSIRTGRQLAKKGLVGFAEAQFNNRVATWAPTIDGIGYVEVNFRAHDRFEAQAVARAIEALRNQS